MPHCGEWGARGAGVVLGTAAWLQKAPILKACRTWTRGLGLSPGPGTLWGRLEWNEASETLLGLWTLRCGELG